MATRKRGPRKSSLREMLEDPIVRAVMSRDGISEREVAAAVLDARRRLAGGERARCARARADPGPAAAKPQGHDSAWSG